MKNFILFLLLAVVSVGYSQNPWASTKTNGFNVLVTAGKDTAPSLGGTIYSSAFDGGAVSGRKIVVGFTVTDTSTLRTDTLNRGRLDVQGSFDGTNWFNVADSAITTKNLQGAAQTVLNVVRTGLVDLSSYNLPWYRLAIVPTSTAVSPLSNKSGIVARRYKFNVSGGK